MSDYPDGHDRPDRPPLYTGTKSFLDSVFYFNSLVPPEWLSSAHLPLPSGVQLALMAIRIFRVCELRWWALVTPDTHTRLSSPTHPPLSLRFTGAKAFGTLTVIDASWYLPSAKRDPAAEYLSQRIPGALRWDFSTDATGDLPHGLPSADFMTRKLAEMGIGQETTVVVYDGMGMFSSPRLWWMLRAFGHRQVSVLDGGLPAWIEAGYPVESGPPEPAPPLTKGRAPFVAELGDGFVCSLDQVRIGKRKSQSIIQSTPAINPRNQPPQSTPAINPHNQLPQSTPAINPESAPPPRTRPPPV